jgi:hypothetical protein
MTGGNSMKTKTISSAFFILVFILSSCGQEIATPVPMTQSLIATQPPTKIPTITALPTPTMAPSPTPSYPTASVVKSNAVAFISGWTNGKVSLWVANVDGSGEKKLTDIAKKDSLGSVQMKWSPNGEWISYKADDGFWLISRDGSIKKKILSFSGENAGRLYTYTWSPDSLKIAYIGQMPKGISPVSIQILDLEAGKILELFSFTPSIPFTLLWSPDGHYLLYIDQDRFSFGIFDLTTHQVVKEISPAFNCTIYHNGISWSPNSRWFFDIPSQNGRFATKQICVAGLDGSYQQININGTATSYPVWDKTGNFIYFAASNTNFSITPIPDYDLRLMRYDVRTQKLERMLSLGKEPRRWTVSMSPDGRILEMDATTSENQQSYIFLDLESLATTRYEISEIPNNYIIFNSITYWSPDSHYIIFLSQSNNCFYKLNVQTGKVSIISGKHSIDYWAVSPVATTP